MKRKLVPVFTGLILFFHPEINFAQSPDLGTVAGFVLFTTTGAVGNTGISHITGNVGANTGDISGFGNVDGVMDNVNGVTAQASADLLTAYTQLESTTTTAAHLPVLGNGEVLFAGVYSLAAAGSLVTDLTLDGQGDSSAVFIFKVGGAFSTAASSSVSLINGALACNVFWKVEGAISMAAGTIMRGTLIANNGAVSMGAGGTLEGRMLSTTGAVSVYGDLAYIPLGCGTPILIGPIPPKFVSANCFAVFSSTGSVSNSGVTTIKGDVGSNGDFVTGFNPSLVTGNVHPHPDVVTARCATDLLNAYTCLSSLPYDIELLYPAQFGNSLVLTPHTYFMNGPAVLTDSLFLNAQGDSDAVFVIQISGNLTTSTYSRIRLINGARAINVFWKIGGEVVIDDFSVFRGTMISNSGPILLNTGVRLRGRALANAGTITTNADAIISNASPTCDITVLPIELVSFTGACDKQNIVLSWSTSSEFNNDYFSIESSTNGTNWELDATIAGAGNSSVPKNYSFADAENNIAGSYYRLKQTDFNGNFTYFKTIYVKNCREGLSGLEIYPNPSKGIFNLFFGEGKDPNNSIEIYNLMGYKIYYSAGNQSIIDLTGNPSGIYYLHLNSGAKIITEKIVVEK